MEHMDEHRHAFLDANSRVIAVNVFAGHDPELLEQVKQHHGAVDIKCCCDYGWADNGDEFFEGKFYKLQPYPEWIRDTENGVWVAPEGWVNPDTIA